MSLMMGKNIISELGAASGTFCNSILIYELTDSEHVDAILCAILDIAIIHSPLFSPANYFTFMDHP